MGASRAAPDSCSTLPSSIQALDRFPSPLRSSTAANPVCLPAPLPSQLGVGHKLRSHPQTGILHSWLVLPETRF
uniref:Uncharacterized protein n=1 Tax=Melopsittacus undulatus TaxID=13146 RepID=A0A8V5G571_MELUD